MSEFGEGDGTTGTGKIGPTGVGETGATQDAAERRRTEANIAAARNFVRLQRGKTLHGYAFTFCKAAFLALLFSKYTLLVTSLAAAILYVAAYRAGVREWDCFVKPPWVVIIFFVLAAFQIYLLFFNGTLPFIQRA